MPKYQSSTELCMNAVTSGDEIHESLMFFKSPGCSCAALMQSGHTAASNSLLSPSLSYLGCPRQARTAFSRNFLPLGVSLHLLRAGSASSGHCPAAAPRGAGWTQPGQLGDKGFAAGAGQSSPHELKQRSGADSRVARSAHALQSVFSCEMSRPR